MDERRLADLEARVAALEAVNDPSACTYCGAKDGPAFNGNCGVCRQGVVRQPSERAQKLMRDMVAHNERHGGLGAAY